jgi:Putative stress-responsive transcriptional regulator
MKKVQKVSIGRYAFTLEEDAYQKAGEYLSELERFYSGREGGKEIMEGIEERMAELLLERCGEQGVASLSVIESVIAVLGRPETIEEDDAQQQGPKVQASENVRKKLYRDGMNKRLGGVCSGMAAYFKMDVLLIRVLWVLLFIGCASLDFTIIHLLGSAWVVPIIYIIMWAVLPEAKTVQQRCEMRGGSCSVDDIERNVANGDNPDDFTQSSLWITFWKVVKIFVGILLLLMGISGLVSCGVVIIGAKVANWAMVATATEWIKDALPALVGIKPLIPWFVTKTVVLLVITLPFIGMIYGGSR